jgi:nucleotide-binding universal stress UspA family protein
MKYLVATDGSAVSELAIEHAASDASVWGSPLEIVHVLTPKAELVDGELVLPGGEKAIQRGERTLSASREIARDVVREYDADIEIETQLLSGYPPEAITDHVESTDVTRIYVGHRGHSEDREPAVGSVAKTVVDKATVPVSIVR